MVVVGSLQHNEIFKLDAPSMLVLALGVHHAVVTFHSNDDLATQGGKGVVVEGCVMELVSKLEDNDMAEGWRLCLETAAEVRQV